MISAHRVVPAGMRQDSMAKRGRHGSTLRPQKARNIGPSNTLNGQCGVSMKMCAMCGDLVDLGSSMSIRCGNSSVTLPTVNTRHC